jgi:hypothetical protein
MEVTVTEMLLFAWAMLATAQWFQLRDELRHHRAMTGEVFKRIAQGRIKVTETEDSFDLVEIQK